MSKDLKENACGGIAPVHFHEDGPFAEFAVPANTTKVYSDVFDLGESLSGICIRAYADEAIAGASATLTLLAGDDKTAAGTDTAAWTAVATSTGTAAAGKVLIDYIPTPGNSAKYYMASLQGGTGVTGGKISVWNELVP